MKKYLLTSAAALAFCGLFTSCTHDFDNDGGSAAQNSVMKTYEQAFVTAFGQPDPNQEWGFGSSTAKAATRTVTVNGDAYTKFPSKDDVDAYFPDAIPGNADEVSELETKYQGQVVNNQTLYGIYQIYAYKIVEGYNLKITSNGSYSNGIVELGGNYQNASWDGAANRNVAYPYNVYVNVDGNLTIRRVGATHFNLYILSGNVTLESNYGEQAGLISVASGATLNDQRNSIAANQGVKIFNRGTINATNTEKYDIGNFCTVYNEGKFNVTGALTYSPGDANDSYFMNLGDDAELTAPSMTLNSTGNFFNSGKTTIAGETNVTQARLYWVNAGHYTTGTMTFSAKNTTFFNYCQLIVIGNAHMYDGEFNLMTNSYTEAGSAEFDNFFINMYGSTGMHVKGTVKLEAQGDGTFQGFKNKDNNGNKYLLIDGKVTIASHKQTLSIQSGITYSINSMEIIKGGNVVTEEYLQSIGDGDYPVTVLQGTECPYGELTVTPNANSCGANWGDDPGPDPDAIRVICEDLSVTQASDWDFNDVVFDVKLVENNSKVQITLRAAGGTLLLNVAGREVHELFKEFNPNANPAITSTSMVSTGSTDVRGKYTNINLNAPVFTIDNNFGTTDVKEIAKAIPVQVFKLVNGVKDWFDIEWRKGEPSARIGVGTDYNWCDERTDIRDQFKATYSGNEFSTFKMYVRGILSDGWYNTTTVNQQQVNAYTGQ